MKTNYGYVGYLEEHYRIIFRNYHTGKSELLKNIEGEPYSFPTFADVKSQMQCLNDPMKNGRFIAVLCYVEVKQNFIKLKSNQNVKS